MDTLRGEPEPQHDFASIIGEEHVDSLAEFLKNGTFDFTKYIDYTTKKPLQSDSSHGQQLYSDVCARCHGLDGKKILFDGVETVGFLANDNPWEVVHKIRCGQPDTTMPSGIVSGWSIQDAVDVLSYAQSLPE